MTATWNPQREARSHRARAGAYTRRAEREAQQAADCYEAARRQLTKAAALTRGPERMRDLIPPAMLERHAIDYTRMGDCLLRASFRSTAMAATYRELGASWAARGREMS